MQQPARLLAECAKATRCDHFGILAGAAWDLDVLGLPGQLARHSDSLGSALDTLAVYLRLNNQGATCYFDVSESCGARLRGLPPAAHGSRGDL